MYKIAELGYNFPDAAQIVCVIYSVVSLSEELTLRKFTHIERDVLIYPISLLQRK